MTDISSQPSSVANLADAFGLDTAAGGALDSRPVSCGNLKAVIDALYDNGSLVRWVEAWTGTGQATISYSPKTEGTIIRVECSGFGKPHTLYYAGNGGYLYPNSDNDGWYVVCDTDGTTSTIRGLGYTVTRVSVAQL